MTKKELEDLIRSTAGDAVREGLAGRAAPPSPTDVVKAALFGQRKARATADEAQDRSLRVGRLLRALAAGKGDPDKAASWAKKAYGDDSVVTKGLYASSDEYGGYLVPEEFSTDVIELLRPASVVRSLNPVVVPMGSGTLEVPKITGGATASYIGELNNLPATDMRFGMLRLTWKKLAALVPVSNDLLRFDAVGSDAIVRDDLVAALAQRSDAAFIRANGTLFTPKGIRYWCPVANEIPMTAPFDLATIITDLGSAVLRLRAANSRMLRCGWLFSPRTEFALMTIQNAMGTYAFRDEMMRGLLWGFPYRVTTQIPENLGGGDESEVYFVDFADVVIGEAQTLVVDVSTQAAYYDGSQVQAAFSRDETVIRAIMLHDLGVRHDSSVAVITGVRWGV